MDLKAKNSKGSQKMKTQMCKLAMVGLVLVLGTVSIAQEATLGFDVGADYVGKYIWRGQRLADQSFQPWVGFNYGQLSGNIWTSMDATNKDGRSGDITEADYTLDWTDALLDIENMSYSAGVIYYTFPNTTTKSTTELYVGLSYDMILQPSVTAYFDVDEVSGGVYLNAAFGHTFENVYTINPDIPVDLELSASFGWGNSDYNEAYWSSYDKSRFNDMVLSAALPMEFKGWTITPSVSYVHLLESGIRDNNGYSRDSNYLYAGLGASYSF
jgi:hypothetical protein